jgi:hypothetical protein
MGEPETFVPFRAARPTRMLVGKKKRAVAPSECALRSTVGGKTA